MGGFHLRGIGVGALVVLVALALACAGFASRASAQLFVLSPLPSDPFAHSHDAYINPFTDPAWYPARTDMGVDWIPEHRLPVLAIGDAVIVGSSSHAGWPGGRFIYYALLNGRHAGDIVYVAEKLRDLAPAGKYVRAGQQIATALPGSPGSEWGWAAPDGATVAGPCYSYDGKKTAAGKEMARFMISLGAHVQDPPGPGPDKPQGGRCS